MNKPIYKVESLEVSNRKNKKYKIVFYNLDSFNRIITHFGSKNSSTFIDHNDEILKKNYILRHQVREKEIWQDKTKFYTPSSLSLFLLWHKRNLTEAVEYYKKHFNIL